LIKLLWNSRIKTTKRRFDPVHYKNFKEKPKNFVDKKIKLYSWKNKK
jgi:hypothetical protein